MRAEDAHGAVGAGPGDALVLVLLWGWRRGLPKFVPALLLASAALYGWVFADARLYSDALLQIFFFVVNTGSLNDLL